MPLVEGVNGLLRCGPTAAPTTVSFSTTYSIQMTEEVNRRGPYIGNANRQKVRGARDSSGSITCEIPVGRDAGQTALVSAFMNGTDIHLTLREGNATDAYTYEADVIITQLTSTGNAAEGYTLEFSFEDNGNGYTYGPST